MTTVMTNSVAVMPRASTSGRATDAWFSEPSSNVSSTGFSGNAAPSATCAWYWAGEIVV